MAYLAEFETAPAGTQYRTGSDAGWVDAQLGEKLGAGYQARNTQSNEYQVKLYSDAEMRFETAVAVSLSNITGTVRYEDSQGGWHAVSQAGDYDVQAVRTAPGGGVSIACSIPSNFRPPPFK